MKKIISIVIASFMFCNIGFAEKEGLNWIKTDYTISHYLKNGWALTFVDNNDYTLQTSKSIISCRVAGGSTIKKAKGVRLEYKTSKCFKPVGQK